MGSDFYTWIAFASASPDAASEAQVVQERLIRLLWRWGDVKVHVGGSDPVRGNNLVLGDAETLFRPGDEPKMNALLSQGYYFNGIYPTFRGIGEESVASVRIESRHAATRETELGYEQYDDTLPPQMRATSINTKLIWNPSTFCDARTFASEAALNVYRELMGAARNEPSVVRIIDGDLSTLPREKDEAWHVELFGNVRSAYYRHPSDMAISLLAGFGLEGEAPEVVKALEEIAASDELEKAVARKVNRIQRTHPAHQDRTSFRRLRFDGLGGVFLENRRYPVRPSDAFRMEGHIPEYEGGEALDVLVAVLLERGVVRWKSPQDEAFFRKEWRFSLL